MSFKFAIRPASDSDALEVFELITDAGVSTGTLDDLRKQIAGLGSGTHWIALRDGLLLGVVRAVALGPGFVRMIAVDQIVLAPAVIGGVVADISALQVATALIERSLGDMPALAVINETSGSANFVVKSAVLPQPDDPQPDDSQSDDSQPDNQLRSEVSGESKTILPSSLAILSKALLGLGFTPRGAMSAAISAVEAPSEAKYDEKDVVLDAKEAESVAESAAESAADLVCRLAAELGDHVKSGQVFVR